jgi:hypothetical protein
MASVLSAESAPIGMKSASSVTSRIDDHYRRLLNSTKLFNATLPYNAMT